MAVVIPVALQPEPPTFDADVRQKGVAWLTANAISLKTAPPKKTKLPPYWQECTKDLWDKYDGTCAYLAIFFEFVTGAASTDHFVAKSKLAGQAYEWNNFRLSALGPNRNKNKFDDVLDPIGLAPNTFVLNLASGKIRRNKNLQAPEKRAARKTIQRLRLDGPAHQEMRARHFTEYLLHRHAPTLKKLSPFVWFEANRQGLL